MKKIIALLGLLAFLATPVMAQQYGLITTIESHAATNGWPNATTTNLAASVSVTKWDSFTIQVVAIASNAMTGGLDIAWDLSSDNANYPAATAAVDGNIKGWFRVPLTNNTATTVWSTNIPAATIGAHGYWRANYVTNASGQYITNLIIRAYGKPKRQG